MTCYLECHVVCCDAVREHAVSVVVASGTGDEITDAPGYRDIRACIHRLVKEKKLQKP